MDDIRKVPESLRRGAEGNREISAYGNGRWGNADCGCGRAALPFYMTYPLPMTWEEEDTVMRDLDYLTQMYPRQARKYTEMIGRILDTMDYSGSVIYDEYPDRLALFQLSEDVWKRIREEEASREATEDGVQSPDRGSADSENMKELIQILLYYEIFRRRRRFSAVGYTGAGSGRILSPGGQSAYGNMLPSVPCYGAQNCFPQQAPRPLRQQRAPQMPVPPMPVSQAPMWKPTASRPQMPVSQFRPPQTPAPIEPPQVSRPQTPQPVPRAKMAPPADMPEQPLPGQDMPDPASFTAEETPDSR